ncbi:hypothetical protein NEF87_002426 [Candidatus Lokiarchaeum ossiferum]|uniref:YrdC-like domain-containing protein n=1 Tax=Candidatus Lokiarchaeum ossiferum TaxID=2951803 RepID=A0ABY6HU95_9ARCH|nr:hypothetical protein NEF87_002426 [Candidatus Lokiarchaeum sp. B-35]
MGLLVKLKNSQKKQWDFLLQCAKESHLEENLIALPFNRGGYGLIANPEQSSWQSSFTSVNWGLFPDQIIFILDSLEQAMEIGIFSPIAIKMAQEFWPKELILQVPINKSHPLFSKLQKTVSPQILDTIFPSETIKLMIPNDLVFTAFIQLLKIHKAVPILVGIYAQDGSGVPCVDSTRFAELYTDKRIGMILDHGTLQKGRNLKSATIVECLDDVNIDIIKEGLISTQEISSFIEKCDEEESTDDEF